MNKFYLTSILTVLFISTTLSQSTYYKMLKEDTTTWQHYGVTFGVENKPMASAASVDPVVDYNSYAALDTITFNGKKYRKLYKLAPFGAAINYTNKVLNGYLREDTILKKVFYTSSAASSEYLLYDFNVAVSNTVLFTFPNNSNYTGNYMVDSIITKNTLDGPRKHFYLKKATNPTANIEYIEGVGSTFHLAHIFAFWQNPLMGAKTPTCAPKWEIGLTCKHNDAQQVYQTCVMTGNTQAPFNYPPNEYCNYTYFFPGALKTNDPYNLVKMGPNPSNDELYIQFEQSFQNISLSITDLSGKLIIQRSYGTLENNSIQIPTKILAPGVYSIKIKLDHHNITKPILIQH